MKTTYAVCAVYVSLGLSFVNAAYAAAPGDLDVSFNKSGIVATLPGKAGYGFSGNDVIQQADGKLVVAGYRGNKLGVKNFALVRYNSNGTLDTEFNGTGEVDTTVSSGVLKPVDIAQSLLQQADGKLVAAGTSSNGVDDDCALARYNKDGSLDATFNDTGIVTTPIGSANDKCYTVIQQTDGKLVAAGTSFSSGGEGDDFAMVRYNRDGSLDTSFGVNGTVVTPISTNGSRTDNGKSVIQLSDGKLLMVGYSEGDFVLVRYNLADGSLDTTFDGDGKLFAGINAYPVADVGLAVIQQSDDKIVIAGYSGSPGSSKLAVARYNLDGTFDSSFSSDGKLNMPEDPFSTTSQAATSVIQQADGKLVLGGYSSNGGNAHFALIRLNADGSRDDTFNFDGVLTTQIGTLVDKATAVIQQADGKLVLAGYGNSGKFDYIALARYHSENDTDNDGVPDSIDALPGDATESVDTDRDGTGNNADTDDDNDAIEDGADNCPLISNPAQTDADADGLGDACDDQAPLLYTAKSTNAKDRAGYAVAYAGDINKDGYGDYVIGMSGFDPAGKIDAGRAQVISGKTGAVLMSVDGAAAKDGMGYAVAGNADIDNDGNLDVVVGAPKADAPGLLDAGSVTVLYGPDGVRRDTFSGLTAKALSGSAVALGDVNGDSFADILIGAPRDDDSTHPFATILDTGSVTVRSGDPRTSNAVLKTFYGVLAKAYAGTSVAAGDFDGDGDADIIVGAPNDDDNETDSEIVYLDTGSVTVYDLDENILFKAFGFVPKAYLGKSVAVSDIDGDDRVELLAGAPGDDLLNEDGKAIKLDVGSVMLFAGGGGDWLWQSYGRTLKAGLGNSVAFGDVNGDLVPDIIAGASKDDKPALKPIKDTGSVSVWNGVDYGLITTLYGKTSKDYFGAAVSSGDINSDGNGDLLIGIGGADIPALPPLKPVKDTGSVQILSGGFL
ncbi:MAG TPA: thrombospondin type 3 repeat-containing protein [Pseudomonadales bacterium]|nr:thrombospondin type 3 repeat-containing protein [Pseudomonadales bacterium]